MDHKVDSHTAFEDILTCYVACGRHQERSYADFLREDSLKQVIVVTDDTSYMGWTRFRDEMRSNVGDFVLNGVVGLRRRGCVEGVGDRYITGANETGGALLHICDNDWTEVIDVLVEDTITRLTRNFVLSRQPIPATIQVYITQPGQPEIEQLGNWNYVEGENSIVFDEGSAVPDGWQVVVRYKIRA